MTSWTLLLRSVCHFWRTNLGIVLGAACATAVLVGALLIGDSVRQSLREQALQRVGRLEAALLGGERYFRSELAGALQGQELGGAIVAPAIRLSAVATKGSDRAGIVDVLGVEERFAQLASSPRAEARIMGPREAWINEGLASHLRLRTGEEILLRLEKPSPLARELAVATIEDVSFALRVKVAGVLTSEELGDFSPRASQIPPFNVFVSLSWLQEELALPGKANTLLVGRSDDPARTVARADDILAAVWKIEDAGLVIRRLDGRGQCEVTSERIFIEQPVIDACARIEPGLVGVLTWFVNTLRLGQRATPYSMVSAIGPLTTPNPALDPSLAPLLDLAPPESEGQGIVVNHWLARDLEAGVGDQIEIAFYVMGSDLRLREQSRVFPVANIVQLEAAAADSGLMPGFPGLADAENCRSWEPGMPVDLDRIREIDEEYWDEHRGTPKAFIALETGQSLWGSRFGTLTAIRASAAAATRLEEQIPRTLAPAAMGLFFQDLRGPALAAGRPTTDFGGLFLGLSFFLIVAALILTALLFVFGVEQRAPQVGILLAVGYSPARVRRLFLGEAAMLTLLGSVVGAFLGLLYTRGVLLGLGSIWRDAVGAATLTFHARPSALLGGMALAVLTALLAIFVALRKAFRRPALELLRSRGGFEEVSPAKSDRGRPRLSVAFALVCAVGAGALVLFAGEASQQAAGAFFGAGSLLLLAGLLASRWLLARWGNSARFSISSVAGLGLRNAGRRLGRSCATIALLASGVFLVVAVQAYRLEPPADFSERSSGTGGFALFGRSTLPVLRDLETGEGRAAFGLQPGDLTGVSIVPLRVREGDDASCLNLNQPQNPRLVGVSTEAFADRGAFKFAESLPPGGVSVPDSPWRLLEADYGPGVVPAIGDQASVTWILHKKLGDDLVYLDDRGEQFHVRIVSTVVGSILQGNLVISGAHFEERFPSVGGHRMFLIDAPSARVEAISAKLTHALADIGFELTPTLERLRSFNEVQNTYLLIFQALGGLGLLLGSVGLAAVVLRNVLERRGELAVVRAVGYPARVVRRLVWTEHGLLLILGLGVGAVAAAVATLPGLEALTGGLFSGPLVLLLLILAVSGGLWVFLASAAAIRGPLLDALRDD